LWKYCKADLLVKNDANKILFLAENLIDEFIDISENNNESLNEAIRLNHSTYDMLYFTLARRTGATLMTLDSRLNSLAKKEGIDIVEV
jgi:predicted nucleic acid-binding protein